MWYLKFRLRHKGCVYTPKTKEYGITDFAYPLGHVTKGKAVHVSAIHVLQGAPRGIKKYVAYLKKHPSLLRTEGTGNVLFVQAREQLYPKEYRAVYNPELLHVAPVINDADGFETWQTASWKRGPLETLVRLSRTSPIVINFELLEFRQKAIHDVYIASLLPRLPTKQREALRLAYEQGYYQVPRKIDLADLARFMKISKATAQEHLRRAEAKIIPFILQQKLK